MSEDAVLLAKVREALGKEEARSRLLPHLHLRAVAGVIFLDGEVETAEESAALEAAIKEVEGVHWVQNRLQVNPPETPGRREPHRHER